MSLPPSLLPLQAPAAYPHPCGDIAVIETHISWVLLTGTYAYKIKKPVRLPFLDFSTLDRRGYFCREELRCNARFAPDLYFGVVAVVADATSGLAVSRLDAAPGDAVLEWAVCMRQFDPTQCLDKLVERDAIAPAALRAFGCRLAALHAAVPAVPLPAEELVARVIEPERANFRALADAPLDPALQARVAALAHACAALAMTEGPALAARLQSGAVRECHGDLHLGNLVLHAGVIQAFDGLEFDLNLRLIDVASDLAFLLMDLRVRGRTDLAYGCLDGYLDVSGDYGLAPLLPHYMAYRAIVRAKVAGIELAQNGAAEPMRTQITARLTRLVDWVGGLLARPPGQLVLMCGLSGSGKSWVAERLVPRLGAVRLRSDVLRRAAAVGTTNPAEPGSGPGGEFGGKPGDRYTPAAVASVYDGLRALASRLLAAGEDVILDATFLVSSERAQTLTLARSLGSDAVIVYCTAPLAVLEARLTARAAAGNDASEADVAVLARQLAHAEVPTA
ncbi:MAG: AAA family ATPase, partial [Gammaproteobacteria bacterium]